MTTPDHREHKEHRETMPTCRFGESRNLHAPRRLPTIGLPLHTVNPIEKNARNARERTPRQRDSWQLCGSAFESIFAVRFAMSGSSCVQCLPGGIPVEEQAIKHADGHVHREDEEERKNDQQAASHNDRNVSADGPTQYVREDER